MSDDYSRHVCPACNVLNFVCNGDVEDMTSSIGEGPACKCWVCGHKFWRCDLTDGNVLEFMTWQEQWDPGKSNEENLAEADEEEGLPDADFSSLDKERFLDDWMEPGTSWRGFLLERLKFINGGNDFWNEPRKRRLEIVNEALELPDQIMLLKDPLIAGMKKHEIMHDRQMERKDGIKIFRMRLGETLVYLTNIGWSELRHDPKWKIHY